MQVAPAHAKPLQCRSCHRRRAFVTPCLASRSHHPWQPLPHHTAFQLLHRPGTQSDSPRCGGLAGPHTRQHIPRAAAADLPWDSSSSASNNGVPPSSLSLSPTPAPPWYTTPTQAITTFLQPVIQFYSLYQGIIHRCLITLAMLIVHRVGLYIPMPGLDLSLLPVSDFSEGQRLARALYGQTGALPASIFELGISPYINASIIIAMILPIPDAWLPFPQLKAIKDARKEGKAGQAYITGVMNLLALGISVYAAFVQAVQWQPYAVALGGPYFLPLTAITLVAGSAIIQYCASIITSHGIGNGSSLVISCGIVSEYAETLHAVMAKLEAGAIAPQLIALLGSVYLVLALAAVYMSRTELRLPILQYNKTVASAPDETAGGADPFAAANGPQDFKSVRQAAELRMSKRIKRQDYFPIPINGSGMMAVILAGAVWFFMLPNALDLLGLTSAYQALVNLQSSLWGLLVYGLLVFMIEFLPFGGINAKDVAEYFSAMNVGIRGVVPGEPTERHVQMRLLHCKFWGGLALACLAVAAHAFDSACMTLLGASLSATSLLIIVGTVSQTSRQVESLLEGPKLKRQLQKEQSLIQSLTSL